MIVEGVTRVDLPAPALWSVLADPRRLGEALPNVGEVKVADDDTVSAVVAVDSSLGVTTIPMTFAVRERQEPERVVIEAAGARGPNAVRLAATLELVPDGDVTDVRWHADVQLLGVIGAVGQRAVPWLAREQIAKVLGAARTVAAG